MEQQFSHESASILHELDLGQHTLFIMSDDSICYGRESLLQNRLKGGWNKKPEGEACFNNLFLRMVHEVCSPLS